MKHRISFVALLFAAAPLIEAQVGYGTLLTSPNALQNSGVTSVALPGNPSITTHEVLAWSQGEANGRMRSLFNAQALGIVLGDRNGDGLAFDWGDVDSLEVSPPQLGQGQPTPYDLRFSLATNVLGPASQILINTGDIIQLTGVGAYQITIPRGAFQAALGTSTLLDVDGYAEVGDGAILVTFRGTGSGTNIINPSSGQPGTNIAWYDDDVFIIRPPFGALPAIIAYRHADLAPFVSNAYPGVTWAEIRDIAVQPVSPGIVPTALWVTNPWDPTGLYQAARRPRILWLIGTDDNVFCTSTSLNPLSSSSYLYAIAGNANYNASTSAAGFTNNTSFSRAFLDALAIWPQTMTTNTRVTLDVNNLLPAGGSSLTITVRSTEAAGTRFQIALSASILTSGQGLYLSGSGYQHLLLPTNDPLLFFSLNPAWSPFFLTAAADANGTASTIALPLPTNIPNTRLWLQGFEATVPYELTAPLQFRIQ